MAVHLYKASGTFQELNLEGEPTLEQLQGWVGGYIEHVHIPDYRGEDAQMWLDEEGKLKSKPVNVAASKIFWANHGKIDVIVGDAVILTGKNKAK